MQESLTGAIYIQNSNASMTLRLTTILILFFCLPACSSDDEQIRDTLYKLCPEDGGIKIYKPEQSNSYINISGSVTQREVYSNLVFGYFDKIQYISTNTRNGDTLVSDKNRIVSIYIADRPNTNCPDDTKNYVKSSLYPYYTQEILDEFNKEYCVAVDRNEKLAANYTFKATSELISGHENKLRKTSLTIKNNVTGNVIAEAFNYYYKNPKNFKHTCGNLHTDKKYLVSGTADNLLKEVLAPKGKNLIIDNLEYQCAKKECDVSFSVTNKLDKKVTAFIWVSAVTDVEHKYTDTSLTFSPEKWWDGKAYNMELQPREVLTIKENLSWEDDIIGPVVGGKNQRLVQIRAGGNVFK